MNKKTSFILAIASLLVFPVIVINYASGQMLNDTSKLESMTIETGNSSSLGQVEIGQIVARGIQVVLGFLAIIFLGLTISSGFTWMTAQGNDESIKKAQGTLKAAIIGLIIVLAAYTITYFIFAQLPFGGSGGGSVGTGG